MKKRLFAYTVLMNVALLAVFFALSVYITRTNNINRAKDSVIETARVCSLLYTDDSDIKIHPVTGFETRITIISRDGTVLKDSRPLDEASLENHLDRPEIIAATNGTPTAYLRRSESLGVDFIYYALMVENGDGHIYIRAAIPVAEVDAYLSKYMIPLFIAFVIAVFISFVFSRAMIARITRPFASVEQSLRSLSDGEFVPVNTTGSYEDVNAITKSIGEIAGLLERNLSDLSDEKNKLTYILDNITDGIFVTDAQKRLILINKAAHGIFNSSAEVIGKDVSYLIYDEILENAIDGCLNQNNDAMFERAIGGNIYFIAMKRLPETEYIVTAITDVTEARENAKLREDFFSNASHELKTPLTAIRGFNELTDIHNKDENITKYIDGISRETERMLALIEDMLRLSELENTVQTNPEPVSLSSIISEAREALLAAFDEKSAAFETSGDAIIYSEPEHIFRLVKNLMENAVRYNKQNGTVTVTVKNAGQYAELTVSDDGIGIPSGDQSRIFERFYRVEKSRSARNGGTGLGLSIVKHICVLYGWELSLKSKQGVGTEVVVRIRLYPFN